MSKRALVISGGGSKGAFPIGLESVKKADYDVYVGSSTGALAILLCAMGKYKEGKEQYLSTTNSDIYDNPPFNKKGKISKFKILTSIIKGRQSLSSTTKLLTSIREIYTKKNHKRLITRGKDITVVVSNMTTRYPEYKNNNDYSWEEFTYWVWVSTLAYPFTETVNKDGYEYADGGFTVSLPVEYACLRAKTVRAIVLSTKSQVKDFKNNTVIQGFPSIISFIMSVNLRKDIKMGEHYNAHDNDVEFIFMPHLITDMSMLFEPEKAYQMYQMGRGLNK